jgi:hypothetical protein
MARELRDTPARVVEAGRVQAFGAFTRPFPSVNVVEADVFGLGRVGSRLLNRYRLKEWQHFAVFGPDLLFTFVVLDAHYLASSFCYFVDRATGAMVEHHREGPSPVVTLARELWDDRCSFRMPGYAIGVHNHLDHGRHTASIAIRGTSDRPGLSAELELLADLARHQPLEVVLRLAENRPAYSHKMVCPARGRICVGDRELILDPARHLVAIDVHKAFYPYRMQWRWATCAGYDGRGRLVGLNLTHNVIADDTDNNENGLWVGDRLSLLGAARFTFDENDLLAPWRIETGDGRCRLIFRPQGERAGLVNAGVISSDYHQPYGTFSGEAIDDAGETHAIRDLFGVTEVHRARF